LDPGHGGKDPGALGGDLQEKDINLEAALYIGGRLSEHGFIVGYTRTTDEYDGDLEGRGKKAAGYDYFLSVHCNAGDGVGSEVYCNTRETYAYTEVALRDTLSRFFTWRKIASRRYDTGAFVTRAVSETTRKFTSTVDAADYYGVLRGCWSAGVSGDLLEMFFIDSEKDREVFMANKKSVFEAIVEAICKAFGIVYAAPADEQTEPEPEPAEEIGCEEALAVLMSELEETRQALALTQSELEACRTQRDEATAKLREIKTIVG
jgi:N-acetylmuramoyl-L-alanine amidase